MRETCMVHHFSQRWKFVKFRSKLFLEILVLQKCFVKSWFQGMFRLKWCISNEISNEIFAKTLFWSEILRNFNFTEMAKFRTELGQISCTLVSKRNFFFSFDQKHYSWLSLFIITHEAQLFQGALFIEH